MIYSRVDLLSAHAEPESILFLAQYLPSSSPHFSSHCAPLPSPSSRVFCFQFTVYSLTFLPPIYVPPSPSQCTAIVSSFAFFSPLFSFTTPPPFPLPSAFFSPYCSACVSPIFWHVELLKVILVLETRGGGDDAATVYASAALGNCRKTDE